MDASSSSVDNEGVQNKRQIGVFGNCCRKQRDTVVLPGTNFTGQKVQIHNQETINK